MVLPLGHALPFGNVPFLAVDLPSNLFLSLGRSRCRMPGRAAEGAVPNEKLIPPSPQRRPPPPTRTTTTATTISAALNVATNHPVMLETEKAKVMSSPDPRPARLASITSARPTRTAAATAPLPAVPETVPEAAAVGRIPIVRPADKKEEEEDEEAEKDRERPCAPTPHTGQGPEAATPPAPTPARPPGLVPARGARARRSLSMLAFSPSTFRSSRVPSHPTRARTPPAAAAAPARLN